MSVLTRIAAAGGLLVAVACTAAPGEVTEISADALLGTPPAGALILDVRSAEEFASGHVPGATNLSHESVAARLGELEAHRDQPVVVYCESGRRAGWVTDQLLEAGFTDVRHLTGDMRAWREAGRPVEKP